MYGDGAGYPIVDFGGWKIVVGPNCMENEEIFGRVMLNGIVYWPAMASSGKTCQYYKDQGKLSLMP